MTTLALARPTDWSIYRKPLRLGLSIVGILDLLVFYQAGAPGYDTYAYWVAQSGDPYQTLESFGAYHYTPALLPLWAPLAALAWPAAYWAWVGVMFACLAFLGRSWALALLAFPPVAAEVFHGNVHLLIAVAIVVGFRYSAAWAFPILTKLTPGVGVLWFAFRREWRPFGIALGVTAAIVGFSFLVSPGLWVEWWHHTFTLASVPDWHTFPNVIPIPIVYRLPIAVAVVWYAARTDRRWLVPVAVTLAIPLLWFAALSILVACIPLYTQKRPATGGGPAAGREGKGITSDVRAGA